MKKIDMCKNIMEREELEAMLENAGRAYVKMFIEDLKTNFDKDNFRYETFLTIKNWEKNLHLDEIEVSIAEFDENDEVRIQLPDDEEIIIRKAENAE